MKQFFTLLSALFIGAVGMSQAAFQSDLSSWTAGIPSDWDGTATNLAASAITEVPIGATYGTSMVQLVNTASGHKRFSSQPFTVMPSTQYEVTVYIAGTIGEMRSGYYDITNSAYNPTTSGGYNNYVDISTISGGATLGSFSQFITTDGSTTSMEVILSFRGTDANGLIVDSVSVSIPSNPPSATPRTIFELQNNGGNSSAFEDSLTITSGVVTAVKAADGYWIQDGVGAWTGVYVKDNTNTPLRGDSVTVTGTVAEVFGVTQIEQLTNFVMESTPTGVISATEVSSSDINNLEDWEGVLVKVVEGECVTVDAGFGQWTINNGLANSDSVLVDDDLYSFTPALGEDYNVTGIGHYSFSASKLLPRDVNDIEVFTEPSSVSESKTEFSMYPNPATNNILITSPINSNLSIYTIAGKEIYSNMLINGKQLVSTTDFTPGIYLVKLISNGTIVTKKLIVE